MGGKLILFDIPDKNGRAWSFNVWKTLNYKGIDYETEWLEYPDIKARLEAAGIEPWLEQRASHTCPAVQFPDGTYVMNSAKIIKNLEERYPEKPLHPDSEEAQASSQLTSRLWGPLQPVMMPEVYRTILGERSQPFFWDTRKDDLGGMTVYEFGERSQPFFWDTRKDDLGGMTVYEFEDKYGGERAWERTKQAIEDASTQLNKTEGPFFLGDQVSYADFIYVGLLETMKKYTPQHYQRVVEQAPALQKLYEACAPWLERDN
ncbi:glutathione S-transferase-like protein ustS [Colletotrichum spaethianum]|uniref:Glutathione S-transferase-like protein ustS n=1 Tax=Colletotrichum spaethianum TaxID=700344 RepID=A0AA37UKM7_9PEZI|nr:glutathione S-transferase-like protein ustS [Colletotrichum spaethianum]GKT51539.1 glutathione S-transferase-like protein ustS [Colletotrichum spaethianum]